MNQDEGLVRRFYRTEEGDKKLREAIIREEREEARNEGLQDGLTRGRAEGRAEGRLEGKREIVINMHKKGIELETISEIANLDIDEIKAIIEQSKNN